MKNEEKPVRIIVEVAQPEVVADLRKENMELRDEVRKLEGRLTGLHETVYRLLDRFGELRRSVKER